VPLCLCVIVSFHVFERLFIVHDVSYVQRKAEKRYATEKKQQEEKEFLKFQVIVAQR